MLVMKVPFELSLEIGTYEYIHTFPVRLCPLSDRCSRFESLPSASPGMVPSRDKAGLLMVTYVYIHTHTPP